MKPRKRLERPYTNDHPIISLLILEKMIKPKSVFLLLIFLLLTKTSVGNTNGESPEIVAYYRNHNYVNAFSSGIERSSMTDSRSLKRYPESVRLKRVLSVIEKMNTQVIRIDPGMYNGRIWSNRGSEIIEVLNVEQRNDSRFVRVRVRRLDTEINVKLVSDYEKHEGKKEKLPSEEELLRMVKDFPGWVEVHEWKFNGKSWMKTESNTVSLSR